MWTIISFLTHVVRILFPPACYGCGTGETILCEKCLKLCRRTVDTPSLSIISIYSFKDPLIKRAIHAIKYYHRRDLIDPLTEELAEKVRQICTDTKTDAWVLVPIPMPRMRASMRGYNQAELIAQALSAKSSPPSTTSLLVRTRTPKRQVKTSTRSERLHNQRHSFSVAGSVKGMHIILVDDVTTTGATLLEARAVLLKGGASCICAVTIAH